MQERQQAPFGCPFYFRAIGQPRDVLGTAGQCSVIHIFVTHTPGNEKTWADQPSPDVRVIFGSALHGSSEFVSPMTPTHWIVLAALVVSGAIALVVAYQQRKQMRQIELYKLDPSVGLLPPPSALSRFVKSKWDTVLGIGGPSIGLWIEMGNQAPLTRISVFLICLLMALIVLNVVMSVLSTFIRKLLAINQSLGETTKAHFEITKSHTGLIAKLADAAEILAARG